MKKEQLLKLKSILFGITAFLATLNILLLIFFKDHVDIGNVIFRAIQYTFMLLVLAAPRIFKKWFNLEMPLTLYMVVALFAFCAFVLGEASNFYGIFPWWDSFLHFQSGFILSFIGLWLINVIMQQYSKYIYLNKYFLSIFIIMFSLGIGAFWEICEYIGDDIFHTNSQQYMETTEGTLTSELDVPKQGHEALEDTMKDLMLDMGGAVIVSAYGFINHDKLKKRLE